MSSSETLDRRDARVAAAIVLTCHAVFAAYVAAMKTGPDEFFPVITYWRVAHPMETLVPRLSFLALVLSSLMLTACGSRLRRPANVASGMALPWMLSMLLVVPNAPTPYAAGYAAVCALAALYLYFVPQADRTA